MAKRDSIILKDLKVFDFAQYDGVDKVLGTGRSAAQEVLQGLLKQNLQNEYSSTELRKNVLDVFGVLTPLSNCVPLTHKLRSDLMLAVDDFLQQHAKAPDSPAKSRSELPPSVVRDLDIPGLMSICIMSSGRSGAEVHWVQFRTGGSTEIGVLKMLQKEIQFETELMSHRLASESWLEPYVPAKPDSFDGVLTLLYRSAIQPKSRDPVELLLDYHFFKGSRSVLQKISLEVGDFYFAKYLEMFRGEDNATLETTSYAWQSALSQWPAAKLAWTEAYYWHECNLPSLNEKSILAAGEMLWNPIYLADNAGELKQDKINWIKYLQHGDLNPENVLVDDVPQTKIKFIDFEKSGTASGMLDLCWLALWAIRSSCRKPGKSESDLKSLIDSFCAAMEGKTFAQDMREHQLGIDFTRTLFSKRFELSDSERLLTEPQLHITMSAGALAMSFYEARSVKRIFDARPDDKKLEARNHRIWAAFFLGLSARLLSEYVQEKPCGPAVDLDNVWSKELVHKD